MLLTIAICTYNRPELLNICLNTLVGLLNDQVEVLVVDNGTQPSLIIVKEYDQVRYVNEENTGLSYARNRAIVEAHGEWVLYIDDDAKVDEDLIDIALEHCKKKHNVFGGIYLPWYHFGKPKWFKDEYGSNSHLFKNSGILKPNTYLSGGVLAIHKSVFEEVGIFNTNVGMIGLKAGYGEESELQDRMQRRGIVRRIDIRLKIYHVVAEYKLKHRWFLNSNKNRGSDMAKYAKGSKPILIIKAAIIGLLIFIKDLIRNTPKLLTSPNYFIENWKIETLKKVYKRIGYISQLLNPETGE